MDIYGHRMTEKESGAMRKAEFTWSVHPEQARVTMPCPTPFLSTQRTSLWLKLMESLIPGTRDAVTLDEESDWKEER